MVVSLILGAIGVVVVLAALYAVFVFNGFIKLRSRIDNAWSQIDVQLKRRFDLIPNLVETVKGYAKHEKETFENVTKARAQMAGAKTVGDMAKADNVLSSALKSLFAVAENYPDLKANENFKMLQEELAGTENKIAYARQFYNDNVMEYNMKRESFPSNIIASMFGFSKRDYFEVENAAERKAVQVKF